MTNCVQLMAFLSKRRLNVELGKQIAGREDSLNCKSAATFLLVAMSNPNRIVNYLHKPASPMID